MTSVFDVAAYILKKKHSMTTMKLQKLCYYSQAWSLVWDEKPLFPEGIQAWANGPVCPDLYHQHKGLFKISDGDINGDASKLDVTQQATVNGVLSFYGDMGAYELSQLTHHEAPWKNARNGLPSGVSSSAEIKNADIAEYYGGLTD